jgi:uncharacterized protein YjbJ (UPF0337 family)
MHWDEVSGNWKQMRGAIKNLWGELTDDDLTAIDGDREKLLGRLQERYGMTEEDAERQVAETFSD